MCCDGRRLIAGIIAAIATFDAAAPPATAQAEPHRVTVPSIPGMTGRFALKTTTGREVTEASFPGKWLVIYFGYTLCPDACPTALNAMAGALGELGAARCQSPAAVHYGRSAARHAADLDRL